MAYSKKRVESRKTDARCARLYRIAIWAIIGLAVAVAAYFISRNMDDAAGVPGDDGASRTQRPATRDTASRPTAEKPSTAVATNTTEQIAEPAPAPAATNVAAQKSSSIWANKPTRVIKHRESDRKPRRFTYDSEEAIADLLEIEPGTLMYGDLPYGKRFVEDFKQAIMQKVKIKPEDDEYTRNLKQQVQAVKDDLTKVLIDGGDVGEEMRKAREDLKQLGGYKEALRRELFNMRKSGEYTSEEMEDYIAAANKMLENKGLKPLNMPRVFLRNLQLREGKITK